jgi:hypothetical protein
MKTRLGIFIVALLLLPLAGIFLSGNAWHDLSTSTPPEDGSIPATLRTSIMLLLYVLLVSHTIKRLSGNMDIQRLVKTGIASVLTGWLFSYLNLFVASWTVPQNHSIVIQVLLYTPLFALLAPAVLVTRDLLACFPGVLKSLVFSFTLPEIRRVTQLAILLAVTVLGLSGGAAQPAQLFWLFWMSPLTLLMTLQLLWHENTLFSEAKSGDWGPVVCSALSGIIIGNIAVITYQSNAYLQINLPNMMVAQAGLALFGLLCLQLTELLVQSDKSRQPLQASTARKI